MGLHLHNTLSRRLERFQPLEEGRVGVYACGPTVYGPAHIGNFRSFVFYDLVHRALEWMGFQVRFVMNLTDVDDKTIRAAGERGLTLETFTAPYAKAFLVEADALGIRRFDLYPRATHYVEEMKDLVQRLLDRGMAYPTEDGSVFFDISAFPEYGKLSGRDLEQVRTGERVAADEYGKEDARDFALWKGVKPGDEEVGAAWEAPWGRGRPGWHLECSAMALTEVGTTLDLHLGGEDLVFPHHEDEIAQSEGATGKPFVQTWLHVKHLRVEGRKMSKSLGNFITVQELLAEGVNPAAIRHQLLSAHYRSELNFTREGLEASDRAVRRLLDFEARLRAAVGVANGGTAPGLQGGEAAGEPDDPAGADELGAAALRARGRFTAALEDDLNVAEAMAALFVLVSEVNGALDRKGGRAAPAGVDAVSTLVASMDDVLGLLEVGRRGRQVEPELEAWVEARIERRREARAARDWSRADAIREELSERGIAIEDTAEGTRWKRVGDAG
jgi:cysteinyl-tRNA synthetase